MIIPKKLLIAGALILSMHHGLYAYDACTLNAETAQILNFAQTLRQANHKDALSVARWLEQQVCDASCNADDNDIFIMANVINNPDLTIPSKISLLSQMITVQKAEDKKTALQTTLNAISAILIPIAFLSCFTALAALSIVEEMANPTKKLQICVEHFYPGCHTYYQ